MFTLNIYISKHQICFNVNAPNVTVFLRPCTSSNSIHGPVVFISMRGIFNSGFVVFCPGYRWWRDLCWTVVAASAVSDDGRPVGSGCCCFPAMDVHGGVSHHAPSHVWSLAGCHWGLHPDPCQNLGGDEMKHFLRCIPTIYSPRIAQVPTVLLTLVLFR